MNEIGKVAFAFCAAAMAASLWGAEAAKPRVTADSAGYFIDGQRGYLVSGEFHYFRVPKADWRRRMDLAKAAGMNAIATYVPWLIHEPTEGKFLWSDCGERDFRGFLKTAQEAGLMVIVRPGPYQYSELRQCGLPAWVLDKQELRAKNAQGGDINVDCSVSYNHPEFLRLTRRYFKSFAEQVKPFLQQNGGPVVMVQLDNEVTGIHDWMGGHDHNPETFGFGREDGYFATWLKRKYGTLEKVNAAYGTDWKSFADARPIVGEIKSNGERRRFRDFRKCYLDNCGEYVATLRTWLQEDGISGPYCCNCANPDMNNNLRPAMKRLEKEDVFFGSDHYYTLSINCAQEFPALKYAMGCQRSLDTLGGWGYPPTVFEMPAGSISAFPGLFRNDLLACYMLNFVYGMKGVNYYIYTGGPNFEGTGGTCDIYDYNAPITADGKIRETYYALKDFGTFLASRRDLADSRRLASVAIGFVTDTYDGSGNYGPEGVEGIESGWDAMGFTDNGILYSLSATPYTAKFVDLASATLDPAMPLILPSASRMDAAIQRKVADFVLAGGSLLVAPCFPTHDWDMNPCTVLADALGALKPFKPGRSRGDNVLEAEGERLYGMDFKWAFKLEGDATEEMRNAGTGETIGYLRKAGKGTFCQLGTKWTTTFPDQTRMLAKLLDRLGAKKMAGTDSLNLPVELHRKADGSLVAFVLNLHASPQTANLEVWKDGKSCYRGEVKVGAMQVLPVDVK